MSTTNIAEILNRLFHVEERSLIPRLAECEVSLSWASANDHVAVRHMTDEEQQHVAWLVELMNNMGETPTPTTADPSTTSLHYVDLSYVIPRVIDDKRHLLAFYEEHVADLSDCPDATQVVAKIIGRHKAHLEILQAIDSQIQRA